MWHSQQKVMRMSGLAFLLGIVATSYLPELPEPWWCSLFLILLPIIFLWRDAAWLKLVAVFFMGGIWLTGYVNLFTPSALPPSIDGQTTTVTGQIVSIPQYDPQRIRFDFEIHDIHDLPLSWRGKVRLSWYRPQQMLQPGQRWELKIKLKPVHGFANPGGLDYESWLFSQRVAATGYVQQASMARLLGQDITLHSLRQSLSEQILLALADSQYAGLLIALITGDRQHINQQQWQVMARTGTTHLMAISGLHIGLVYGLFFWLGRMLWRSSAFLCLLRPAQDAAMIVGLIAALLYAAMAGFSIPTQRALIMIAVVTFAALNRRMTSPLDVLQTALLIVLLIDPLAIMAIGFWLSFAAVAVILLTLDQTPQTSRWYQLFRIQWALALGLLPLTSLFFSQVSVIAPLMNIIAVPWVGLIVVPLSLAGTLMIPVSPMLAYIVLGTADTLMQWLWLLLLPASNSPYAVLYPASPPIWVMLCASAGLILVLFHRTTTYRIAGLCLLAPLLISAPSPVDRHEFQVDILDVGQGLAVVVRTAEHTLLYDTGFSSNSGFDTGRRVILPYFRHEGVHTLDQVVLSHDDQDHAGGYDSIRREMAIRKLTVMPGSHYLAERHTANICQAGDRWQWDGVNFEFLSPGVSPEGNENNRSCVLKISADGGSILLTGDIEKTVERKLVTANGSQLRADILLAPHHGSATSSSREFIDSVKPAEVVFTAGFRNRFGFPKPSVVARYRQAGVRQWVTADTGMIRYRFRDRADSYKRFIYREEQRRFWQSRIGHRDSK